MIHVNNPISQMIERCPWPWNQLWRRHICPKCFQRLHFTQIYKDNAPDLVDFLNLFDIKFFDCFEISTLHTFWCSFSSVWF